MKYLMGSHSENNFEREFWNQDAGKSYFHRRTPVSLKQNQEYLEWIFGTVNYVTV